MLPLNQNDLEIVSLLIQRGDRSEVNPNQENRLRENTLRQSPETIRKTRLAAFIFFCGGIIGMSFPEKYPYIAFSATNLLFSLATLPIMIEKPSNGDNDADTMKKVFYTALLIFSTLIGMSEDISFNHDETLLGFNRSLSAGLGIVGLVYAIAVRDI